MSSIALKKNKFIDGFHTVAKAGANLFSCLKETLKDPSLQGLAGLGVAAMGLAVMVGGGMTANPALVWVGLGAVAAGPSLMVWAQEQMKHQNGS